MKYIKFLILSGLILFIGVQSFDVNAQRRSVVKKEVRVKKVTKRKVIRRHHRTPHYHYRNMPRWGYWVSVVPPEARVVRHKDVKYRYLNGVYYRPYANKKFMVVAAPQGMKTKALPVGHKRIVVRSRTYYYYYGTYYQKNVMKGVVSYETTKPPVGAKVDALPEGYEEMELGGAIYYVLDDQYYKEIVTGDGENDVHYELVNMSKSS